MFYILGFLYSHSLYLCRVRTSERGAHLLILEEESQMHPTTPSMPGEVTLLLPEEVLQVPRGSWTITAKWKAIVNKSGMRKEESMCPADKMCLATTASHHSSVSARYSRYTNTSQGNGRKSPCCRMPFEVHVCVFLRKELFFSLHDKHLKISYNGTSIRGDKTFIWAEKRVGGTALWIQPHHEKIIFAILPELMDRSLKHL